MKLTGVELRRVALPLVTPFRTSFGVEQDRDVLLVRAVTDRAEGWGECVAAAEPRYSSEYADGAADVLAGSWSRTAAVAEGSPRGGRPGHGLRQGPPHVQAARSWPCSTPGCDPGTSRWPAGWARPATGSRPGCRSGSWTRCPSC